MYELLRNSIMVVSIPSSDSSPRSVYEAIFCGCVVCITYHPYYDVLPQCMKDRIIVVDLNNKSWFKNAFQKAKKITHKLQYLNTILGIERLYSFFKGNDYNRSSFILLTQITSEAQKHLHE